MTIKVWFMNQLCINHKNDTVIQMINTSWHQRVGIDINNSAKDYVGRFIESLPRTTLRFINMNRQQTAVTMRVFRPTLT